MDRRTGKQRTEHHYVGERLSAYLDGELTPQERRTVEQHLARCQACRWELNTLRQTVQWLSELPPVPVPRAFTLPVTARPVRAPQRSWGLPLLQGATVLVALLLVVVVVGDFLLTGFLPAATSRQIVSYEQPLPAAPSPSSIAWETREVEQTVVKTVVVEEGLAALSSPSPTPMPAPTGQPPAAVPGGEAEPTPLVSKDVQEKVAAPPPATVEERTGIGGAGAVETMALTETETTAARLLAPGAAVTETEGAGSVVTGVETAGVQMAGTETPAPTGQPNRTTSVVTGSQEAGGERYTYATALPTERPTREAPTVAVYVQEPAPAVAPARQGEAGAILPDTAVIWLGVAELTLLVAFILLASATLAVMLRRRRRRSQ